MTINNKMRWLLGSVAAIAISVAASTVSLQPSFAQDGQGKQAQGSGGGEGGGGENQGGKGAGEGNMGQGGGESEEEDPDKRGPKYGQPDDGDRGGKPVWAGEFALPVVELGRLNVIRSPDNVLDSAYEEIASNFTAAMEELYDSTAADFAADVTAQWDEVDFVIIDSPLQNLAVLEKLWTTGSTGLGIYPEDDNQVAGILIGVAADKELAVTADTVVALAIIIGATLTPSDINEITAAAQAVQTAVVQAHDS